MNQDKRVLLTIVLSVAILFTWYSFFAPKPATKPTSEITKVETQKNIKTKNQDVKEVIEKVKPIQVAGFEAEEKTLTIKNDEVVYELNTRGAILTSAKLKKYRVSVEKDAKLKDLLQETKSSNAGFLGIKGYENLNKEQVYKIVSEKNNEEGYKVVELLWQDKKLQVRKFFTFGSQKSKYAVLLKTVIKNIGTEKMTVAPFFENQLGQKIEKKEGGFLSFLKMSQQNPYLFSYYKKDEVLSGFDSEELQALNDQGHIFWSALGDRYFTVALTTLTQKMKTNAVYAHADSKVISNKFEYLKTIVNPGEEKYFAANLYIGPKKISEMLHLGVNLDQSVDYGWFGVIAVPILKLMTFLHSVIPSWGMVIILLTVIVKLLLYPINKKSMGSMKAMQQLQPKLQEIKKRYPDDSGKQNQEVMQLFRTHKVNPLSGCFLMFLQMPIYFALYRVLWNSIELYHSSFLFYRDLTAPDPYFIAPILLGIFMFLQQKLTPSASADPTQQKMMMFMPIMFSGFMLFLPVGLVVYIFVNTLMSVIQQYMMQKDIRFRDLIRGKWQTNGS